MIELDLVLLTNRNGGDLSVDVQHAVAVHVHQVVSSAVFIVTKEVDCTNILQTNTFGLTITQSTTFDTINT